MTDIKKANKTGDYELIEKLADIIWREHYIPIVGKPQIDYMLDKYQSVNAISNQVVEGYEYYTVFNKELPVGYMALRRESEHLFLSKIYVLRGYRGKGIGKKMMTFISNKATVYQLKFIRLTVNINNINSIKAYERLGFENVGPLVTDIGNGFVMDDYVMVKEI